MVKRRRVPKDVADLLEDLGNASTFIRRSAIIDLAKLASPEAVPLLEGLLRDREAAIRACAAWALGEMGAMKAGQALADCLSRDMDVDVRRAAAQSLSRMAQPEHQAALESAGVDADRWVAEWARRGLARLLKSPVRRRRPPKAGGSDGAAAPPPPGGVSV